MPWVDPSLMGLITAVLLGLTQGLSEFLPISSSGHLVMVQEVLGVEAGGVLFEVVVHVGTLLAVLLFYRERIFHLLRGMISGSKGERRYLSKLALGSIPAAVLAFYSGEFLVSLFDRPWVCGVALVVTGCFLWTTRLTLPSAEDPEPGYGAAFLIGCAQALAIVPGISRSGATVAVALALGVRPIVAAEFSFLLSVIAILGAFSVTFPGLSEIPGQLHHPFYLALAVSCLSGLAALWVFVRLLRLRSLYRFAYYDVIVGSLFLIWLTFG